MITVSFIRVQDETALVDLVRVDSMLGGDAEVSMVRGDAEEGFYRLRFQDAESIDRLLTCLLYTSDAADE